MDHCLQKQFEVGFYDDGDDDGLKNQNFEDLKVIEAFHLNRLSSQMKIELN